MNVVASQEPLSQCPGGRAKKVKNRDFESGSNRIDLNPIRATWGTYSATFTNWSRFDPTHSRFSRDHIWFFQSGGHSSKIVKGKGGRQPYPPGWKKSNIVPRVSKICRPRNADADTMRMRMRSHPHSYTASDADEVSSASAIRLSSSHFHHDEPMSFVSILLVKLRCGWDANEISSSSASAIRISNSHFHHDKLMHFVSILLVKLRCGWYADEISSASSSASAILISNSHFHQDKLMQFVSILLVKLRCGWNADEISSASLSASAIRISNSHFHHDEHMCFVSILLVKLRCGWDADEISSASSSASATVSSSAYLVRVTKQLYMWMTYGSCNIWSVSSNRNADYDADADEISSAFRSLDFDKITFNFFLWWAESF